MKVNYQERIKENALRIKEANGATKKIEKLSKNSSIISIEIEVQSISSVSSRTDASQ